VIIYVLTIGVYCQIYISYVSTDNNYGLTNIVYSSTETNYSSTETDYGWPETKIEKIFVVLLSFAADLTIWKTGVTR
jgi:hypothetical protein